MLIRKFILLCLSNFIIFQVGHSHDSICEESPFCWSKEKSEFAEIGIEIAASGTIQNFIQVSGTVATHPDHLAHVIAQVHGVVTQINKNLWDCVEKDEVIAILESQEIAEAKSAFLNALHRWEFQKACLAQEEALKGISSRQDYLKAKFDFEQEALNKELALQKLHALGIQDQEIEKIKAGDISNLRFYAIKSPIKGKILQRNLTLGELIHDEAKIFTIGNFNDLWVEINIPQNDLHYLSEGLPVEMKGIHGKYKSLHLSKFNPLISEQTRTARAIAYLDNQDGQWSPGEFVTIRIQTDQIPVPLIVPQEAILQIKGADYIFVQHEEQLIPKIVKVGKKDEKNVEILSGLKVGESYAACNTFCLKAEYEKEEAEHHH